MPDGTTLVPFFGILVLAALAVSAAVLVRRETRPAGALAPVDRVPLAVEGVATSIGGRPVLAGISLTVDSGRIVGLLGPNGSGKTTLLRIIAGLERAEAGEVRVFGHRMQAGAPVLRHVGVTIGRPSALPHRTGRENLRMAWAVTGRPQAEACFGAVEEYSRLGNALDRRVADYSEGMKQSLALAIAMLGLPDLLVLDEPTNALDPLRSVEVREGLRAYVSTGRSVLITTHHLVEAERLCDQIAVITGGRIVLRQDETGPAGTELQIRATQAEHAAIVSALVEAGVAAAEVRVKSGLEDHYLRLLQEDRTR